MARQVLTMEENIQLVLLLFSILAACIRKLILLQILKNKFPVPFTVIVLILGFIIGTILM
jgi:hypothetical protein